MHLVEGKQMERANDMNNAITPILPGGGNISSEGHVAGAKSPAGKAGSPAASTDKGNAGPNFAALALAALAKAGGKPGQSSESGKTAVRTSASDAGNTIGPEANKKKSKNHSTPAEALVAMQIAGVATGAEPKKSQIAGAKHGQKSLPNAGKPRVTAGQLAQATPQSATGDATSQTLQQAPAGPRPQAQAAIPTSQLPARGEGQAKQSAADAQGSVAADGKPLAPDAQQATADTAASKAGHTATDATAQVATQQIASQRVRSDRPTQRPAEGRGRTAGPRRPGSSQSHVAPATTADADKT
ncbi:MAG: hypothetical protein ACOC93_05670, partial [Planctomycetota bacterium]